MNTSQSDPDKMKAVGKPMDRVDGRLKVTGAARYAAEFSIGNMTHAVAVGSTIARGRITAIDARAAVASPGVIAVITHLNAPKSAPTRQTGSEQAGRTLPVLQNAVVNFYGQYISVVVAETLEQAQHAATLVRITYREERPITVLDANLSRAYVPRRVTANLPSDLTRGDLQRGLNDAEVEVNAVYTTPVEHHNPMEPSATIAVWENERLTLYESTQTVSGARQTIANTLGMPEADVRVVAEFVGGGFGCKDPTKEHAVLAAIAAKFVQRPVKLVLSRQQMFTGVGYRSRTIQRVRLGAKADGQLTAVSHHNTVQTSTFAEFIEKSGALTPLMYECPNLLVSHRGVRLNVPTPTIMRAPGEASGSFALECAMDELAYELKMDPIALRMRNEPARDPESGLPWSSRSLVECFRQGATRFGWERRNPLPRSTRDGRYLVGYGAAGATRALNMRASSARVRVLTDGDNVRAVVQLAATDLGTGTYTILTQVAADTLGVQPERVRVEMGDTRLPPTPGSAGSWGAVSYGSAVRAACLAAQNKLLALVQKDARSPLHGFNDDAISVVDGRLFAKGDTARGETYAEVLQRHNLQQGITAEAEWEPDEAARKQYSMHTFGAQFAEVRVDSDTGEVRVTRFLGAFGAGRILNAKTARAQVVGGIIWGISMALHEETVTDARYGHFVNHSLAEYHVPVNADIGDIDAFFVEENDPHVNPLGVKGIGEIGIVGVAAAIANAMYHATGKRVRDLPITPDKLL